MRLLTLVTFLFAAPVALLTSTAPAAQERPFDSSLGYFASTRLAQDRPTFRSKSELVVLHVSVRDRGGRYITGLGKEAFTVIDDGKPQTLEMFSADEVPATVGFLIDNSNSMRPNRERVVASAVAFARNSHPQDEIFVLTFNEKVRRAWGPSVVAETDPETFTSTMLTAITARGMTAIYDGIIGGLEWLGKARHTRQVLIVVSDGDDNASMATLEHALKQVHESDATVYTVALMDRIVRGGNRGLMKRLARETGGEFYEPRDVDEVPQAFEKIAKDIRSAYTLAYIPTASGPAADERRRRTVRVYVRPGDGRVINVRTRDGYFEKTDEAKR